MILLDARQPLVLFYRLITGENPWLPDPLEFAPPLSGARQRAFRHGGFKKGIGNSHVWQFIAVEMYHSTHPTTGNVACFNNGMEPPLLLNPLRLPLETACRGCGEGPKWVKLCQQSYACHERVPEVQRLVLGADNSAILGES